MTKTLFIASFVDLTLFDLAKFGIRVVSIDNSDYFFKKRNHNYVDTYIESLKSRIGTCDIILVPVNDKIISALLNDGIKCIVLYPRLDIKQEFLKDLEKARIDLDYISMLSDSWDFLIKRLDKRNYPYKVILDKDDNVLEVLNSLLSKKEEFGSSYDATKLSLSDEVVNSIFSYCLLSEEELDNGKPKVESTYCEGIKYDYLFSTERLDDKKDNIVNLIDSIKEIDKGISVKNLGIASDGKTWTNSLDTLEKVMALGVSTGYLFLPFPRTYDMMLINQLPYVIKRNSYLKETST